MLEIIAIRHGITEWNLQKRIQGHTDIPLCAEGIAVLQQYRIPAAWRELDWYCSPLQRTRQTANALGLSCRIEPALIEMSWGDWEGGLITELRRADSNFVAQVNRGIDLQTPGGESPLAVQQRLTRWAQQYAATLPATDKADSHHPRRIGIVTHKGVMRAMLAAACDWQMLDKPPVKLDYQAAQWFGFQPDKPRWQLLEANIRLLVNTD